MSHAFASGDGGCSPQANGLGCAVRQKQLRAEGVFGATLVLCSHAQALEADDLASGSGCGWSRHASYRGAAGTAANKIITTAAARMLLSCWFSLCCSCTDRQRQAWAKQHGGYLADQLGSVREASGRVQVCWCLSVGWRYS